jgi:hypothetical protein
LKTYAQTGGTGKLLLTTCHEGTEGEKRYSFSLSLTSTQDGVEDSIKMNIKRTWK